MLASHDGAAQVDGGDAVERNLGDLVEWRVAAGDTHPDIVVKNVDSPPTPLCGLDHCREGRLLGNISLERDAFSARHRDRFGGRPLPNPWPGDWPAPTMMAILFFRRMLTSVGKAG